MPRDLALECPHGTHVTASVPPLPRPLSSKGTVWTELGICAHYISKPFLLAGFFAHKVEHESKTHNGRSFQRTGTLAFERVYTANQNCVDAYPTFLVMLWSAGLLCSQVPAAFAGLMYLFVRQKYFVGYLGERTQR
ncbi:ALOX5AP [Cervus elaphus hippelaphus]|uniref:Arachidonate 5-lipoxygenase-activating protein n=1 Tax=Cervus elaphus hippelaphus TaxID=46360 RepID=A0A212C3U1_CEREH|nr:ALOX5AP [Cervus elaphus hippelaphus]